MSANKDHQPDGPGRRCRNNPALGPLGEINLGSNFGFGPTPSARTSAAKQPGSAQPHVAAEQPARTPIPSFSADPIFFASRSAIIPQRAITSTREIVAFLSAAPAKVHLTIGGYSDTVGEAEQNLILSQQRAVAVLEVLLGQNIAEARLRAEGHGGTDQFRARGPAVRESNTYHALRANRRVEFTLSIDLG